MKVEVGDILRHIQPYGYWWIVLVPHENPIALFLTTMDDGRVRMGEGVLLSGLGVYESLY